MIAKGAETLPNKIAHDYKAIVVTSILTIETLRCEKL